MRSEETARRPMSYAGASDTGPCEGRHASPSNPTGARVSVLPKTSFTVAYGETCVSAKIKTRTQNAMPIAQARSLRTRREAGTALSS